MKVEHSGWYKTRDGRLAEVVVTQTTSDRVLVGYIVGAGDYEVWNKAGDFIDPSKEHGYDLIEYLGKERPKQKKTVKMAPALIKEANCEYLVTTWLFQSEERAKNNVFNFVRWLIDTPMAIEVEVEE